MKKIRFLAAALCLALLAGCGTTAANPTETPAAGGQSDDLVYQLIGITKDTPMLTVDGAPVSAEETLFWMAQGVDSWLSGAGITLEDDWTQPYGATGMTLGDAIKADALATIEYFQLIENNAQAANITFTAEEEAAMAQDFAAAIENSGGEENFRNRLSQMCISREGFEDLNRTSYLYDALVNKLATDGKLDDSYTMEDFLAEYGIYAAKHILLSTRRINEAGTGYEDLSDEEKAAVKTQVDDLRAQLAAANDSEELFDQLMNQYSEDGRDGNGDLYAPEGYTYVYSG